MMAPSCIAAVLLTTLAAQWTSAACDYLMDEIPGYVFSPNFPAEYPNDVAISTCIRPSAEFTLLTLVFFDTEMYFDVLTVKDGNGAEIWSDSGFIIPDIFPLSSDVGFIVSFTSDWSVTYPGFAMYYQPGTSYCGNTQQLHASSGGIIASPGYPGSYSNDQVCSWMIVADEGYEVNLSYDNFELESNFDYLYVTNGFVTEALTGTMPSRRILRDVSDTTNMVFLTFTTDGSVTRSGFSLTYSQIQPGTLNPSTTIPEEPVTLNPGTAIPEASACGLSPYDDAGIPGGTIPGSFIVGGWLARLHEFPWQTLVYAYSTTTYGLSSYCGGSLVHSDWILTAAHCVDDPSSRLTIYLGVSDQTAITGDEVAINVAEIILHTSIDVALLRLDGGVSSYNDFIFPVCMPTQPSSDFVGDIVVTSGWGRTGYEGTPDDLLYVTVPVMDDTACQVCWPQVDPVSEVCVGECGDLNSGPCMGDSGGPLVRKKEDGRWELIGVVNWVSGNCMDAPSVYADVYNVMDWIESSTGLLWSIDE